MLKTFSFDKSNNSYSLFNRFVKYLHMCSSQLKVSLIFSDSEVKHKPCVNPEIFVRESGAGGGERLNRQKNPLTTFFFFSSQLTVLKRGFNGLL